MLLHLYRGVPRTNASVGTLSPRPPPACAPPLSRARPRLRRADINTVRVLCNAFGLPSFACEAQAKVTGATGVRDFDDSPKEPAYTTLQNARSAGAVASDGSDLRRSRRR